MKYLIGLCVLVLASCSDKHEEGSEWKEMDEFHDVMASVYHPFKDNNDLGPIKAHADELAASATKWAEAELPSKMDNDETKGLLIGLRDGCQQLAKSIKDGVADDEISTKLTTLHEQFHSIMEKWHEEGKEEGSEEHHEHH